MNSKTPMGIIAIILCACLCIVLGMFLTNSLIQVDVEDASKVSRNPITVVTTQVTPIEDDPTEGNGIIPGLQDDPYAPMSSSGWYTPWNTYVNKFNRVQSANVGLDTVYASEVSDPYDPIEEYPYPEGTIKVYGNYVLYKQPPWEVTNDCYFYDYPLARYDVCKKLEELGIDGNPIDKGAIYHKFDMICNNAKSELQYPIKHGFEKYSVEGTDKDLYTKVVDGVACIGFAPQPTLIKRSYISSDWYKFAQYTCAECKLGESRFCLVLCPSGVYDDPKQWVYAPLCPCDAKAHTYPYGVMQTNIRIVSPTSIDIATDNSGSTYVTKVYNDCKSESTIRDAANTLSSRTSNDVYSWARTKQVLELYGVDKKTYSILNEYQLIGFISWGDTE